MPLARLRRLVMAGVAIAVVCAPQAAADPRDWVPWCSGDQTPMDDNCRVPPSQVLTGDAPGANPGVPLGVNPGVEAVTGSE